MSWPKAHAQDALQQAIASNLTITGHVPLTGGDINRAARLETTEGAFFIKWNETPAAPAAGTPASSAFFSAEAEGLRVLAASGTPLVVPEVIAWADPSPQRPGFVITSLLDDGPAPVATFDTDLGEGLAVLHRATRSQFGFSGDNYLGTTPQPNPDEDRWIEFYRAHRLAHQVRIARTLGRLTAAEVQACDRLGERLDRLLTESPPALIHGDLWAGNLHRHQGRPALIDPAAYYGHPEAELGMMTLFGGFSAATYDAYAAAAGLQSDWRERQPLYQLYHLLNHANLFGGSYGRQSMRIVRRYVG